MSRIYQTAENEENMTAAEKPNPSNEGRPALRDISNFQGGLQQNVEVPLKSRTSAVASSSNTVFEDEDMEMAGSSDNHYGSRQDAHYSSLGENDLNEEFPEATQESAMEVDNNADYPQEERSIEDYYRDWTMANLKASELKYASDPDYMTTQNDVNENMRSILVDWLNEVAQEYTLKEETLYLTVNVIDRFLSRFPIVRSKLQLVGVSSMLIAAKYEEIQPPLVEDFVYITDNTYAREEVLRMEIQVLNCINFALTVTSSLDFVKRYVDLINANDRVKFYTNYICELLLQEYRFLKYPPSMIATSALSLALHSVGLPSWSPVLQKYSEYEPSDLTDCMEDILLILQNAEGNNLQAVWDKYSHSAYLRVSRITPPSEIPELFRD